MYYRQDPARYLSTFPRFHRFIIHRHFIFYSHYRHLLGMDTLYPYKRLIMNIARLNRITRVVEWKDA